MLLILQTLEYATSYFTAILENWYSYKIYPDNGKICDDAKLVA